MEIFCDKFQPSDLDDRDRTRKLSHDPSNVFHVLRMIGPSDEDWMLTMRPLVHEELHARSHRELRNSLTRSKVVNSAHVLIDDLVESSLHDR